MTYRASFLRDLEARGMIHQITDPAVDDLLAAESVTGYIGFDPTASSLHVGSLLPVLALVRLQRAGHRPVALVGGGTGLIGDPSGKSSERPMLSRERLAENEAGLRGQLERFLDFGGERGARMVDNVEWLGELGLLEFLRDVGKLFSVNALVARDSVRRRLESPEEGISYAEFSYALLQAYDFLALHDRLGCRLQMGGSDQWGNIVAGADLVRRRRGAEVHGVTFPLVTRSDGRKFGKSEQGNVWLDAERTSPYELYQFWLNTDDGDVVRYLACFTFLGEEERGELVREVEERPAKRAAQRRLAEEVTRLVHGEEALRRAEHATEVLFGGGDLAELSAEELREAFAASPSSTLERSALEGAGAPLVATLADSGLVPSRGQARKAITGGGIYVGERRVSDPAYALGPEDVLAGRYVVLRRGKKSYHVIELVG